MVDVPVVNVVLSMNELNNHFVKKQTMGKSHRWSRLSELTKQQEQLKKIEQMAAKLQMDHDPEWRNLGTRWRADCKLCGRWWEAPMAQFAILNMVMQDHPCPGKQEKRQLNGLLEALL